MESPIIGSNEILSDTLKEEKNLNGDVLNVLDAQLEVINAEANNLLGSGFLATEQPQGVASFESFVTEGQRATALV